MADEDLPPAIRLMSFVSEEQLEEAKRTRGARVEDGTAQRDRPLYEARQNSINSLLLVTYCFSISFPSSYWAILKENKDRKDAEFNERFKHRPPKALDDDETEFLDKLEMSRRDYEKQVADEEAEQLRSFQAAVAAQSTIVQEIKEMPPVPKVQEPTLIRRKSRPPNPLGTIIKVKPQAKKAKMDPETSEESQRFVKGPIADNENREPVTIGGLVSYSDESDDD
uniref:Protein FAM192A isoform X3 n=1 Tax=Nicotiana sylvestris TaxID=4096 RepID=A0A1U7WTH8_NICSY|nr:PREDICTED: protein FAM192A isoform X3 [Nicotiana sylvestris]